MGKYENIPYKQLDDVIEELAEQDDCDWEEVIDVDGSQVVLTGPVF